MWRAVELQFTKHSVLWGTDNPDGENFICEWDRATRVFRKLMPVIGPVYYSSMVRSGMLFSTAVERGEGQQDGCARVYHLDASRHGHELIKLRKDRWNSRLFGYGTITFADGLGDLDGAWIATRGLRGRERSIYLDGRRNTFGGERGN